MIERETDREGGFQGGGTLGSLGADGLPPQPLILTLLGSINAMADPIPEPASLVLVGLASVFLIARRRYS